MGSFGDLGAVRMMIFEEDCLNILDKLRATLLTTY